MDGTGSAVGRALAVLAGNLGLAALLVIILDLALRLTPLDEARRPEHGVPKGYYVAHPKLGVTLARNFPPSWFAYRGPGHTVYTNALGCFDAPLRLGSGEPYILAIGDSFTWGYAPLETNWTSLIERETGIRVLKCGVTGTGTRYQLQRLKRLIAELPHAPALVLQLYDTTDFNDDFTFPSTAVADGLRVRSWSRVRLADGTRDLPASQSALLVNDGWASTNTGFVARQSTLYNIIRAGLLVDARIERRRLVMEGSRETALATRYEFNLLLLGDRDYPHVAQELDRHLDRLRQTRDFVESIGACYALFHTNSFRMPDERPLVRRMNAFLDGFPPFLGRMPELPKYRFDPHWPPESNTLAARLMLKRLRARGLLTIDRGLGKPAEVCRMRTTTTSNSGSPLIGMQ
ncbi:MAG: hypothetical protein ACR2PO_04195 [Methyloligellaceae bacterium]